MTLFISGFMSDPEQVERQWRRQQVVALDVLDSLLGEDVLIYVEAVDNAGNVTDLTIRNASSQFLPDNFATQFSHVKCLYLEVCDFTHLPQLCEMSKLKSLSIWFCRNLEGIITNAARQENEAAELANLECLELVSCSSFNYASQLAILQDLDKLIVNCRSDPAIENFPVAICSLANLTKLNFYSSGVKSIPEEIGNLQFLRELHMDCEEAQALPRSIGNLQNLEELLFFSSRITELPLELGQLLKLKHFSLCSEDEFTGCPLLRSLPVQVLQLPSLECLDLTCCSNLSIPSTVIFECTTTSLVRDVSDYYYAFVSYGEDAIRTHKALDLVVRLNRAGRHLIKQAYNVPLGLWSNVLCRCSDNADFLLFFLLQLDTLREGCDFALKRKALQDQEGSKSKRPHLVALEVTPKQSL